MSTDANVETKTNTIPTTNSGDPKEVDSVYHVILNDDLKDEFIKWLKSKKQNPVLMDKDANTNNTWKNSKNNAFFGIGKYPIVEKVGKHQSVEKGLSSLRRKNLRIAAKEATKDKETTEMLTRYNNDLLEKMSKETPSRPRPASPQMGDVNASDVSSGDDWGGGRKKRSRRKRKAIKKRTRKRN